jgi:hypothetical protein
MPSQKEDRTMNMAAGSSLREPWRRWAWVVVFAISFAYVESAVVVYLRKIYFDGAFEFPIATLWENGRHVLEPLILVELGREVATIVMLAAAESSRGQAASAVLLFASPSASGTSSTTSGFG